ncbi:MAG: transglutaminase-like domain-containing protein, partial [Clostridia bacterium]|nr:transglutaminase-like domain-containing protein [Clostridia bacterium]
MLEIVLGAVVLTEIAMGAVGASFSFLTVLPTTLLATCVCTFLGDGKHSLTVIGMIAMALLTGVMALACHQSGAFAAVVGNMRNGLTYLPRQSTLLSIFGALVFTWLMWFFLRKTDRIPIAITLIIVVVTMGYCLSGERSMLPAILALALTVFIWTSMRETKLVSRLIPTAAIILIAALLIPSHPPTAKPLVNAADTLRRMVDEYFKEPEERIAFTIDTEGYNHAVLLGENVVSRLGGPANPDKTVRMRVSTNRDVLLRGTIRRTYTGNAWVDTETKTRYMYADPFHSSERKDVLGANGNDQFNTVTVNVEFVAEGTSTLFVPNRLTDLTVNDDETLYYNSIGEVFLAANAEEGNGYTAVGYAVELSGIDYDVDSWKNDSGFGKAAAEYLQLADGIEAGVYELAEMITDDCEDDRAKVMAIKDWLIENCVYTTDPDPVDDERDFVSQFVLEGKRGYCSYFASAMTVMSRMVVVPARYVEGYRGEAVDGYTDISGEQAY